MPVSTCSKLQPHQRGENWGQVPHGIEQAAFKRLLNNFVAAGRWISSNDILLFKIYACIHDTTVEMKLISFKLSCKTVDRHCNFYSKVMKLCKINAENWKPRIFLTSMKNSLGGAMDSKKSKQTLEMMISLLLIRPHGAPEGLQIRKNSKYSIF